jgi:hypothetical protein
VLKPDVLTAFKALQRCVHAVFVSGPEWRSRDQPGSQRRR